MWVNGFVNLRGCNVDETCLVSQKKGGGNAFLGRLTRHLVLILTATNYRTLKIILFTSHVVCPASMVVGPKEPCEVAKLGL